MENIEKKLREITKIRMTNDERFLLRLNISKFMENHIPENTKAKTSINKSYYSMHIFKITGMVFASFVLLFIGGNSISNKAESSLPGDFLYSLKINTIEEVRGAFIKSPQEKLLYTQSRVAERIKEIKSLSQAGELTAEKTAEIEKALDTHMADITKVVKELKEEDPEEFKKATDIMAPIIEQHKNDLNSIKADNEKEINDNKDTEQPYQSKDEAVLIPEKNTENKTTEDITDTKKSPIISSVTEKQAISSMETSKVVDGIIAKIEKEAISIKSIDETQDIENKVKSDNIQELQKEKEIEPVQEKENITQ